jgi:cysteinyl-tRNA synthetase
MNYTDVDDKTIKGSIAQKVPLGEYTAKYIKAFREDLNSMRIEPASIYCPATEHIKEMVQLIQKLLDKGVAYRGEDGCIYYSIKKFPNYGKLAGIDVKKLKEGARVKQDEYEKEGVGDFALWKAWDENDGSVYWETSLGKGRPGWHIECSAMSAKYLGETFDIHTGGVDNKFPHHENEIAQSEAASGKKFVNYWLHCAHLMVNGEKMSKSKGNFFTLRDIISKGYNKNAVRYTLINSQYRQPLNFTFDSLKDSEKALQGLQNTIERLQSTKNEIKSDSIKIFTDEALEGFTKAMDDDLNVPEAMKYVFEFSRKINKMLDENAAGKSAAKEALDFFKKIDTVMAVLDFEEKFFEVSEEQQKMIEERTAAKKEKNFAKADELRKKLLEEGILLVDNKDGTTTAKSA